MKIYRWCSFTTTQQQSLLSLQAAVRKVKGAEGVSRCRLVGGIPARSRFRPAGWRSKGHIVLKLRPPSQCSATRCLQRSAPVNGSTVLITGASFRLRSVALSTTAWSRRETMPVPLVQKGKTVCASKRIFANLNCRASLACSRSSDSKAIRRSGEMI